MAISLKDISKRLLCDGVSKVFSLAGLMYLARTDLRASLIEPSGAETAWTLGVEYDLSGDGKAASGNLTTTALEAWPAGAAIFVYRETDDIQNNVFNEGDGFPAKNTENAFDRRTARSQEIDAWLRRTLRTPLSNPELDPLSQAFFRAGYLISFDPRGQFETVITKARVAMAPDGDVGPSIPISASRAERLAMWGQDANFTPLAGTGHDDGLIVLDAAGTPRVNNLSDFFKNTSDLDGGDADVDGDGTGNMDGGES